MWNLKNGTGGLIYKTEIVTDIGKTLWLPKGKEGEA